MSDEQSQTANPRKNWLERLGHLFQGEPKDRHQLAEVIQDAEAAPTLLRANARERAR